MSELSQETLRHLEELRRIVNNFRVIGEGVSGSLAKGYEVQIPDFIPAGGGGAPPPPACPSISVTFSGIVCSCVCQDVGGGTSYIVTDVSLNGTFSLGAGTSGTDCCEWSTVSGGMLNIKQYSSDDCSGDPVSDDNLSTIIDVQFIPSTNEWIVNYYQGEFGPVTVFVFQGSNTSASLPVVVNNEMACGTLGDCVGGYYACFASCLGGSAAGLGSGSGGTVTIS